MDSNKKNNLFSKDSVINLIIGTLLAFLASKLLDPVLEKFYLFFLNIGGSFVSRISDSTFKEISMGPYYHSNYFSSYMLFCIVFSALYLCLLRYRSGFKDNFAALEELEKSASDIKQSMSKPETKNELQTLNDCIEELRSSTENIKDKFEELSTRIKKYVAKTRRKHKIYYYIGVIFYILLLLIVCFIFGREQFISSVSSQTVNNIEILSPYISDMEYKELKSEFYSMENYEDFKVLSTTLNEIAENNSISLRE